MKAHGTLNRRECIILVASIWIFVALIGALPFYFSHTLGFLDSYFESMSALTTTGASVIKENAVPFISSWLIFWRSLLQWIGGMGIILLFIAILPALGLEGKILYEAEVTGPEKESLVPRLKKTASILWKIYLGLTLAQILLLIITNSKISLFDAITLTFSTISTGGFAVQNIYDYHNVHTENIVMAFMLLGSINFSIYFHCFRGKFYRIYQPEFLLYLAIVFFSVMGLTTILWKQGNYSFAEAFRFGSFQAISAQSSTGFSIGRYDLWPFGAQALLLILMFIGGMSGSTSGGLKISRLLILFRALYYKIESVFRPSAVRAVKMGSKEISEKTIFSVFAFFAVLILLTAIATFLLILDGIDPETAFGSITCFINNGGLAFGKAATSGSYTFLPIMSKIVCIFVMLLGRLEFFILLVLFLPSFWNDR